MSDTHFKSTLQYWKKLSLVVFTWNPGERLKVCSSTLGTNAGCSVYFCSCSFIAVGDTTVPPLPQYQVGNGSSQSRLTSSCSSVCYLRLEMVLCVARVLDCSDEQLIRSQIWSVFIPVPLLNLLIHVLSSNCISSQHCIFHQAFF